MDVPPGREQARHVTERFTAELGPTYFCRPLDNVLELNERYLTEYIGNLIPYTAYALVIPGVPETPCGTLLMVKRSP